MGPGPGDSSSFGDVLRRCRRAAGLTHEALAEAAGLSARTISDLERGVSAAPRRETLAALTAALGIGPEQRAALEAAARQPVESAGGTPPPHNLPAELTSFVGRERELAEVRPIPATMSTDEFRQREREPERPIVQAGLAVPGRPHRAHDPPR